MADISQSPNTGVKVPDNNVFGGFGAALGYIGAEAATPTAFAYMLWPQRYFSGFTLWSAPWLTLLLPMGGPLHKSALHCLDNAFAHGLFKGSFQGHMLGTSFFMEQSCTFSEHTTFGMKTSPHPRPVRNCVWVNIISHLTVPTTISINSPTSALTLEQGNSARLNCRAQTAVSHLKLSAATSQDRSSDLPLVSEGGGKIVPRVLLALLATEFTAILLTIGLAISLRTLWSLIFLIPLCLKLSSASLSLRRETLQPQPQPPQEQPQTPSVHELAHDFEIHYPTSQGNFMLITGPPSVVLQFFRHYGHPKRNRVRETIQMGLVVLFGIQFPVELFLSVTWMPLAIQYAWLSYQIYIVLAMHILRYTSAVNCASTEAHIARVFSRDFGASTERSLLFGQNRRDSGLVKATHSITFKSGYQEGKNCIQTLMSHRRSVTSLETG